MKDSFDVIVVGSGTSGSVVARRLLDAGQRVLVLEAGPEDSNPAIHDLSRAIELWGGPEDWNYRSVPQVHAHGAPVLLPRGKVLGGSYAFNGTIWTRGAAADYEAWAADGNEGWSWADVEAQYQRIENWLGDASPGRGVGGPIDITDHYETSDLQLAITEAVTQTGLPLNADYNSGSQEGVARQQHTIRGGERLTSYRAYLEPERANPLLTVRTGARVLRLIFGTGDRVIGVELDTGQGTEVVHAAETVVCAGAIDSPRLLLLSGIGDPAELEAAGVTPQIGLSGVGRNLQDHNVVLTIFEVERPMPMPVPGRAISSTHWFWRSNPELELPDTAPLAFDAPLYFPHMSGSFNAFTLGAGLITPKSRGTIRLPSADPEDQPLIDLNAFADPDDLAVMARAIQQCLDVAAAPALAEGWGAKPVYPARESQSDLEEYARSALGSYHHPGGTCKMGPASDNDAVVDPQLRVHGVSGLRIADASIMPTISRGGTNAPCVMIGEQAARFIVGDAVL
ncbi:MAG TPA: GMC family oxidoreductase [Pseudolysinimonas sp.]|nr:GMC family oxidoreductase [Pseudolysinimonas sp.]